LFNLNILKVVMQNIMNLESLVFIIAPISLFVFGVLFISNMGKRINKKSVSAFKLIDDLEKKYIY